MYPIKDCSATKYSCVTFGWMRYKKKYSYFDKTRISCNVLARSRSNTKRTHTLLDEVISWKICTSICTAFFFYYERNMLFRETNTFICNVKLIQKKNVFKMTIRCFFNILTCASFLLKNNLKLIYKLWVIDR